MEDPSTKDTQSYFKEKFKLNPLNKKLSIKQMIKVALNKKQSRDLIRKMYEKNGVPKEDKTTEAEKKDPLIYDVKTLEQIVKLARTQSHINEKHLRYIKNYLKNEPFPSHLRKDIWLITSGASVQLNQNPDYYDNLNEQLKDYPDPFLKSIELDLKRTFPDKPYDPNSPLIAKMRRVLHSYAKRNPMIGYCQGFNFIITKILSVVEQEEEAFWLFTSIIEDTLPTDYFTWMIGVLVDLEILTEIVYLFCPDLHDKFLDLSVHPGQLFSLQWFICLYTTSFPDQVVNVIWDFLFVDGSRVLFKAGLILYEKHMSDILNVQEFHEVMTVFECAQKSMTDPIIFHQSIREVFISKQMLRFMRERIKFKVKRDIEEIENRKIARNNGSNLLLDADLPECNIQWPICLKSRKDSKNTKHTRSFFAYRATQLPIKLVHNYFSVGYMHNSTTIKSRTSQSSTIELKNYNQRKNTFEFSNRAVTIQEKEKIAEIKDSVDPQQIQNSLVIGRQQHTCTKSASVKKNSPLLSKIANKESSPNNLLEDFLKGSIQDHRAKENQGLSEIIKVITRPKSNSLSHFSTVVNNLITRSPFPVPVLETDYTESTGFGNKNQGGPSDIYEYEDNDSSMDMPENRISDFNDIPEEAKQVSPKKETDEADEGDDLYRGSEDIEQISNKEQNETAMDSKPRLSIINYLHEKEKFVSNWNSDYILKSTNFLNEYLSRNSFM